MKGTTNRRRVAQSRIRAVAFGVLAYAGLGVAEAAWQVADQTSHNHLEEIKNRLGKGDVNETLNQIYDSQELGTPSRSGDLESEPTGDSRLDHSLPSSINVGASHRCPSASASGLAAKQRQVCEEIVKTELAKYRFALRMYELAETRYKRLEKLEEEREDLESKPENLGKLQDNSNRLLALISLIQIDHQQHRTYMAAYDARLIYLAAARDALTQQALHGAKSGGGGGAAGGISGDLGRGAVGLGALAAALRLVKTERTYDPGRQ